MSKFRDATLALCLLIGVGTAFAQSTTPSTKYPGVGRDATPKEVAAWDIDVRPDFKGLPKGSGTVAKGQDIWEAKCASCHGVFGESNEVFNPIIGGTTKDDVKTGRVANLTRLDYPGRTTLMKVATLSTLWDYIHRAMPWNAPKSLSTDEVYAVTAFLLNLGGVVPDDYTLSDQNMVATQALMPNRNGMTTLHALWPGKPLATGHAAKPDTRNTLCMNNCATSTQVASFLPDYARNNQGNLREQNRLVGPQRGADTTRPEGAKGPAPSASSAPVPALATAPAGAAAIALTNQHSCTACHAPSSKLVGPSFADIAKKYPGQADHLAAKIKSGGVGVWGQIPMPAQTLSDTDAKAIAEWLTTGAKR